MCGLLGALAPELTNVDYDIFRDLAIVSMLRGYQGAGCTMVSRKGDPQIIRTLGSGSQLVLGEKFNEHSKRRKHSLIFGHTRWPTRGHIDAIEHIHPFAIDHIIGVHNGTMVNVMGKEPAKGESDSELLYTAIAEHGIKKAIEESKGAYSLVWIDMRQKTLNFLRNWERPLVFGTIPNDNVLYWASEPKFLECVLPRRVEGEVKLDLEVLPIDQHFIFDISNKGMPKPVGKEHIAPPSLFTTTSYYSNRDAWAEEHEDVPFGTGFSTNGGDCVVPFHKARRSGPHKKEFGGYFRLYKNFWATRDKTLKLLGDGCDYCSIPAELDDFLEGDMAFFNTEGFLCKGCMGKPEAVEYIAEYYHLDPKWPEKLGKEH